MNLLVSLALNGGQEHRTIAENDQQNQQVATDDIFTEATPGETADSTLISKRKWLFMNGCECFSPLSTVTMEL
jgi:hypothetical protein